VTVARASGLVAISAAWLADTTSGITGIVVEVVVVLVVVVVEGSAIIVVVV
jgi:hypothetical protein